MIGQAIALLICYINHTSPIKIRTLHTNMFKTPTSKGRSNKLENSQE